MNYHKIFKGSKDELWTVSFETKDGENYLPRVKGPEEKKVSLLMSEEDVKNTLRSLNHLDDHQKISFNLFVEAVSGAMLMNMKKGTA